MAKIECPKCKTGYKIADEKLGTKVKCSKCGESFTAKEVTAKKPAPPPRDDDRTLIGGDSDVMPAPAPRERMVRVVCNNCGTETEAKEKLRGKKIKCPDCNFDVEVPELPKPVVPVGKMQCPSCEAMVKIVVEPGRKQDCPKCKYRMTVKAPEPGPFEGLDDRSAGPRLRKEESEGDGKKDKKAETAWVWWPLSQWHWKQWLLAVVVVIILLNIGKFFFWSGDGKATREQQKQQIEDAKQKAKQKAADELAAKQRQDAIDALKKQIDDVKAAKAKADLEEQKRLEAELKKAQEEAKKPKAEKEQIVEKWMVGQFKIEYQKGRFGSWDITKATRKGDIVEFSGTFDHDAINKDNKGPIVGTVSKEGVLSAELTVSDPKGKLLVFKIGEMKIPVKDGKVDLTATTTGGKLRYTWIRDLKGGPDVPEARQTPHDYRIEKIVAKD